MQNKIKNQTHFLFVAIMIAVVIVIIDQLTKSFISQHFMYGESRPITSFLNLTLVYNKGAAFSFLAQAGGWQRYFFTVVSLIAVGVILYLLPRYREKELMSTALALILGGAIGNMIDRIMYGHVIDFLDFYINTLHWPAFNIADSAICLGVALLLIEELFKR